MHDLLRYFIPLFVTIDAFGLLPVFLAVTAGLTPLQRRRIIFESVSAAFLICLGFMFLGQVIFGFLGISIADFRIAGGIMLLVLAILDLLTPGKPAVNETEMVGLVPLAMPLIAGPATLTTVLVLARDSHAFTALSLALNLSLVLILLLASLRLTGRVSLNALRAFSKLVMVLLAAIAVNFIRTGIMEIWAELPKR